MEKHVDKLLNTVEALVMQKTLGHITQEDFDENMRAEKYIFIKSVEADYLMSKKVKSIVSDIEEKEWIRTATLDITGKHEEYIERVKWFFNNATKEYFEKLCKDYPDINVKGEIRKMIIWLTNNNQKRRGQINRFCTGWLQRCQNRVNTRSQINSQNQNINFDGVYDG